MKVLLIPVTPFQQNCSLLIDETTGRAAVCDPGGDLDRILAAVARARRDAGEDFPDARPRRPLRRRGGARAPARHPHRGAAPGRAVLDRVAARPDAPLRLRPCGGVRARPLAGQRRHRDVRRRDPGGLPLPRPYAGPRGVLLARQPAGDRWRCAVRRLHRPHRFPARQPRRPDPLDPHAAVAAGRGRDLRARPTARCPPSARNVAATPTWPIT